jgi:hypothetical protein
MRIERVTSEEGSILVVGVLRGDFFELVDDDGFFFDGGFDLSYEGGVCNIWTRKELDVLLHLTWYVNSFMREINGIGLRTACARRRVDSWEQALGCGDGAFEALDDLGEGVADLGLFFELGLEGGEDGGVEEGL